MSGLSFFVPANNGVNRLPQPVLPQQEPGPWQDAAAGLLPQHPVSPLLGNVCATRPVRLLVVDMSFRAPWLPQAGHTSGSSVFKTSISPLKWQSQQTIS
jgi:hypothetical protein